jgi:hypothetical protein
MSLPIITAIRQQRQLKESVLHTAQELAHRANIYGVVSQTSLSWLAKKCHCSAQTIINHLNQLIKRGIIRKQRFRRYGSAFFEINVYTFCLAWNKTPAQKGNSPNSRGNLPYPQDTEKEGSLQGDIHNLEKGLRFYTPGTIGYEETIAKITRLKSLLEGHGGGWARLV